MRLKNFFMLLLLAVLWGPSFLFIKVALIELTPLTLTALRVGIAALLLNLYVIPFRKTFVRDWSFWKHAAISGFFAQGLPFLLINWGEQHISSGLAAILNGLTPIATIVIAHFAVRDDRMTPRKLMGTSLGFLGMVILILPTLSIGQGGTFTGILAVIIAAFSYGVALVYARKHLKDSPPLSAPASQLLTTSVYLVPLAFLVDTPQLTALSWETIGSVLTLASVGTGLAFVIYFTLLRRTSASYVAQVTYLMPVIGVILGVAFLEEVISTEAIIGGVLILTGIMVVNSRFTIGKPKVNLQMK